MNSHRIASVVSCALFASVAPFVVSPAAAQNYPSKPIHILTPSAAGGTTDILARLFGAKLGEVFKSPVLVENRASATGVLAGEITAKSAPDGYTLQLAYHQHTVNAALGVPMTYHPVNSFTPITQLTAAGLLLVVNPASPPKNLKEFIAWTKTGDRNFGSAGVGSGGHLAGELYKLMTGVKAQHIPYKGTGPALTDLMGGRYDYNFTGLQSGQVQARAGKLRALAVTNPKRLGSMPDVPAVAEELPGFEVVGWYGIIGPAKMPAPLVAKLHGELVKILNMEDIRGRILQDGSEPIGSTPEEFRQFMLADLAKWTKVVKEGGIKAN